MTITAAQQQDLYKLAVGLYGAAPGMLHLNALADSLSAGASVAQVYDALANQASFQGQDPAYGDTASDAQFVGQFVERLVGDSALQADKDAVADYLAAMLPTSTRGALMHLAIDLLDAVDESDATWGEAAARLHNRIEAARYYTEDLAGDATELSTLQGTIAAVTSDDATVRAANHANTVAANPDLGANVQTPALAANVVVNVVATGAGTVTTDVDDNGTADATTTFQNLDHLRTLSGTGFATAGHGQGNDTLNISTLSTAAGEVWYNLTNNNLGVGAGGNVGAVTVNGGTALETAVMTVDGPEYIISGAGDDQLFIDETEAAKNNSSSASAGADTIFYQNNYGGANPDAAEPTVTVNVNFNGTATTTDTDIVTMTGGRVGVTGPTDTPTDTLTGVETINLGQNTAQGIREDDTLDVTHLGDATVNYVNGQVLDSAALQLTVVNLVEVESVISDGDDTVIVADAAVMDNNARADQGADATAAENLVIGTFLNYDLLDQRGATPARLTLAQLRTIPAATAGTADSGDIPEAINFAEFNFQLGSDSDTGDYSNELGQIVSVMNFGNGVNQYVLVDGDQDANYDLTDGESRIDQWGSVENMVAAQGNSIIDVTQSPVALLIAYSRETTVEGNNDVRRVQLSNLGTDVPFAMNYLEYVDNNVGDASADVFAVWNQIEGSDKNETVEVTDAESLFNHTFNLRGGHNEANFNELTRSIEAMISVIPYVAATPATTGLITATVTFTDGNGNPLPGGGTDLIASYSAQNLIGYTPANNSLRIEASQDAEDSISFAAGLTKLFILGEVVSGSDQITVRIGSAGAQDSVVLTGFEVLHDAPSDDIYSMDDLNRVLNNLTLVDDDELVPNPATPSADSDTIAVLNDAVGFDASPAGEISLEVLNDVFGFDFDVLDITGVTTGSLTLLGDDDDQDNDATLNQADAGYTGNSPQVRDLVDSVRVGSLILIDDLSLFPAITFTDASIASAGDEFVLDIDNGQLEDGSGNVLFNFDAALTTFDFSEVSTATDLTISVIDTAAAGVTIITDGKDTITGGAGDDTITGGANADTMDGGIAQEVRTIELAGILNATAESVTITLDGFVLTLNEAAAVVDTDPADEDLDIIQGAGSDTVGARLVTLVNANLADINDGARFGGINLLNASYSSTTDLLTLRFEPGMDVAAGDTIVVDDTLDGGTFAASTESAADGGTGGADTFVIGDTDSGITLATADRITGWDTTDFLALGVAGTGVNYSEAGAAVANFAAALTAANSALDTTVGYAFQFDATNGYLFEDTDLDGSANQVIVLAGIDNTEFATGNIIA